MNYIYLTKTDELYSLVFCNMIFTIPYSFSPFVNGLEKYDDAAELGRNGEDCALHYDTCQYSMDKLPKFFQQQF